MIFQLIFLHFLLLAAPKESVAVSYELISIADGDSFTAMNGSSKIKIRIDAIDAPEKGMPFYKVSKKYLSALCHDKKLRINAVKIDRYGRTVSRVLLPDGRDVSAEMIRAGLAWHYKAYSSDKFLAGLETNARVNKRGLWYDKNPIPPWEIRKLRRKGISTKGYFPKTNK